MTVRTNFTGYEGVALTSPVEFKPGDSNVTTIYFNGRGFFPDETVMTVKYGIPAVSIPGFAQPSLPL